MASRPANEPRARPELGETLIVIHDFQARSSDELSLAKGDKVQLVERDDEFGDGWFLGRHIVTNTTGLFPEVYTRPVAKPASESALSPVKPLSSALGSSPDRRTSEGTSSIANGVSTPSASPRLSKRSKPGRQVTPLKHKTSDPLAHQSEPLASTLARLNMNAAQDSQVLSDTLNVIDEHITNLRLPSNGAHQTSITDSGSEYSATVDHRVSYIAGEETDDEDVAAPTRAEVATWTCDDVAEYLFTSGVEKHHCEIFRDQEITGEVLLGMDQGSIFLKALDLGSVGRRLKTWQKIKTFQDEVNSGEVGAGSRRQTYGSDVSDGKMTRSRTSTLTSGPRVPSSVDVRRHSQTLKTELMHSPVSTRALDSPTRSTSNTQRPSAASVRDLHRSRRHSSNDFRLTGTTAIGGVTSKYTSPNTQSISSFAPQSQTSHKKQPSFDKNWTMGGAYSRPLSSAGFHDMLNNGDMQDSAVDLDRGYFSGGEVEGERKRNVLRKRESGAHSRKSSYADEQRARSGTATSRQSRFGSIDLASREAREATGSPAAQKYYGIQTGGHKRTGSTATGDSQGLVPSKDNPPPTVTRLDGLANPSPVTPTSPARGSDWLGSLSKPASKMTGSLRTLSETVTGERAKTVASADSLKDSPMQSPARTGSSTPSAGPSFELDSPTANKSPSTTATTATTATSTASRTNRKKTKQETSAYTRGLLTIKPRVAMEEADYSGWMKKKSSNLMGTWKPRLFVLKGRRLAYYYSEDDEQEKGLIDISFHRVLPADNERLTGLHATITGAGAANMPHSTLASNGENEPDKENDSIFIFKLVPPRAGLSRAVNFTKPTVHYFAVPNVGQGRLWMAALMKATIDRDDTQAITTTYQQKTISLTKAQAMHHRPPALMVDEKHMTNGDKSQRSSDSRNDPDGPYILFGEADSGVSGLEKIVSPTDMSSLNTRFFPVDEKDELAPNTA